MFLHGGKRHVVVRCEFAHGRVGVHDPRQNVAPRRIGERAEQLVQNLRRRLSIYNHLVVYSSTPFSDSKPSAPSCAGDLQGVSRLDLDVEEWVAGSGRSALKSCVVALARPLALQRLQFKAIALDRAGAFALGTPGQLTIGTK